MSSSVPKIISIEHIHLDRLVIIHGANLCTDNKMNTSRVLINSDVCFPVEVCSNTVFSCYLQGTLNDRLLSETVSVILTTSVQGSSNSVMVNTTIPYTNSLSYWKKNDIVLLVHFNKPYYERLSFLSMYRNIFPLVLFTGPKPYPGVIACPENEDGLTPYQCLSRAVLLHPNHNGYLMAHFDLLPVVYNLENESLTSFWIPVIDCVAPLSATGWYWWSQSSGLNAIKKVFEKIKENEQNATFYGRYAANYQNYAGQNFCRSYSDIFYLPQRFIPDWLVLTNLFGKHGVFHEIAFPTIAYMVMSGNLSANLKTLEGVTFGNTFSMEFFKNYPSVQFIHRIDHALPTEQRLIKTVVQRSLLTTRN
jgi:hypothetical protein